MKAPRTDSTDLFGRTPAGGVPDGFVRMSREPTGRSARVAAPLLVVLGLAGCEAVEQAQDRFRDLTPHEAYAESLREAGLTETALGRDWLLASRAAVESPTPIELPFREEGYLGPEEPTAVSYRLTIPRGRRLTAEVELTGDDGTRLFVDLFRIPAAEGDPARPVVSTDSVPQAFEVEPWREGEYVLRVQPELLRGGRYRIELQLEAQLSFPVEGQGVRAIQSFFGADRDAGARSHAGVDIFARRGTPVVAAAPGRAYNVETTNLGGKVVWVRDDVRNARLYYAHLDSQHVREGDRIEVGDTVGFVGNTGNARTTPPHLHFGVYRSGQGAIDPMPFLEPPLGVLADVTVDLGQLGAWVRLTGDGTRVMAAPSPRAPVVRELGRHTAMRVLGGAADFFRVRLPDGTVGYVAAGLTEPTAGALASRVASRGETVRVRPAYEAPPMLQLADRTEITVLGRFDQYDYVRTTEGAVGWLEAVTEQ